MTFTILDVVLIIVITAFVAFGYALGFIHTLGAVVGLLFGTWLAGAFYQPVGDWLTPLVLGNQNLAYTIAFILLFTLGNRLVGIAFWFFAKLFHLVSWVPFAQTLNRLLGAALGLIEALLALSVFVYFTSRLPFADWFARQLADSVVAHWLLALSKSLVWLLPDILRGLTSLL